MKQDLNRFFFVVVVKEQKFQAAYIFIATVNKIEQLFDNYFRTSVWL